MQSPEVNVNLVHRTMLHLSPQPSAASPGVPATRRPRSPRGWPSLRSCTWSKLQNKRPLGENSCPCRALPCFCAHGKGSLLLCGVDLVLLKSSCAEPGSLLGIQSTQRQHQQLNLMRVHAPLYLSISPSLHLSISPSLHLSISPSLHLSISPSLHLSISPSLHLSISPSLHLSISASLHLSISPSLHLSISLSLYLSISLSPSLSLSLS